MLLFCYLSLLFIYASHTFALLHFISTPPPSISISIPISYISILIYQLISSPPPTYLLSICVLTPLSIPIDASIYLSIYPSASHQSTYLSTCLSTCLCTCLPIYAMLCYAMYAQWVEMSLWRTHAIAWWLSSAPQCVLRELIYLSTNVYRWINK